jgi:hypothetical protein
VEVRTRAHHEVIIPQDLAVVALAYVLPKPVADLACLHAHSASLRLRLAPCTIFFVLHEALSCGRVRLKSSRAAQNWRSPPEVPPLKEPAIPNPEQDRASAIADFLREIRNADRDALVCSIVSRWPDATGDEIERAIELATVGQADRIEG